jgi:hypothetical protein
MRCKARPSAVRCSCLLAPSYLPTCWRERPSNGILDAVDRPLGKLNTTTVKELPRGGDSGVMRLRGRGGPRQRGACLPAQGDDRAAHEADRSVDHYYLSR